MAPPKIDGYHMIWSDDFTGPKGAPENSGKWKRHHHDDERNPPNNEAEIYTDYASNAHLSGDGQLYIVPVKRTGNAGPYWTSARLESHQSWYAAPGKSLIIRAEIRVSNLADAEKTKGIWPAFWALGTSHRNSVPWPKCGERDIFEVGAKGRGNINQATLHYRRTSDNEHITYGGADSQVSYHGDSYNHWEFKSDRRKSDRAQQSMTWLLNGKQFYRVMGHQFTEDEWRILAWEPYFVILNVAVGGESEPGKDDSYPGKWGPQTVSGFENAMRVRYVAVYESD